MADDDIDDDFDPEIADDDLDAEVEDVEDLDDAVEELDDDEVDAGGVADVDDEDEDAIVEEPVARVKKKGEDDDDDDDELDPDDVEADLDAILKDRIAAADDEDEDESEEDIPAPKADTPDGVVPKRANEFTCMGCFLLVNRNQFGPIDDLQCPVGESDCPAIEEILHPSAAKPAKAERPAAKAAKSTRKR
jgi:hypothetical protein